MNQDKCKYCRKLFGKLKRYGYRIVPLCQRCLFLIVDEWDIKKIEYVGLQDGRNFCPIKNPNGEDKCTYEINHQGKCSWETG